MQEKGNIDLCVYETGVFYKLCHRSLEYVGKFCLVLFYYMKYLLEMFLFGFSICLGSTAMLQVLQKTGKPKNLVHFACLVCGPECHADRGHGETQEKSTKN